jgi:hypothetical protein
LDVDEILTHTWLLLWTIEDGIRVELTDRIRETGDYGFGWRFTEIMLLHAEVEVARLVNHLTAYKGFKTASDARRHLKDNLLEVGRESNLWHKVETLLSRAVSTEYLHCVAALFLLIKLSENVTVFMTDGLPLHDIVIDEFNEMYCITAGTDIGTVVRVVAPRLETEKISGHRFGTGQLYSTRMRTATSPYYTTYDHNALRGAESGITANVTGPPRRLRDPQTGNYIILTEKRFTDTEFTTKKHTQAKDLADVVRHATHNRSPSSSSMVSEVVLRAVVSGDAAFMDDVDPRSKYTDLDDLE